ncbi:zinc-ribbon domain-containing protein [Microbacteriaceae bacterium 4G12]
MFLLFGTRPALALLVAVTFRCDYCGQTVAQHVYKNTNRFTVFFIPLFSFSTSYFVECTNCGGATALTEAQAQRSMRTAGGTPNPYGR